MQRDDVWIFNHYGWSPKIGKWNRHFYFSKYLGKAGKKTRIFCGSYLPGFSKNLVTFPKLWLNKEEEGVKYYYLWTNKYKGNGPLRILSFISYFILTLITGLLNFKRRPFVIVSSSVHPLAWISGYLLSLVYKTKFIAETRDLWPKSLIDMEILDEKSFVAKMLYKLEKFIYTKADGLIFTMPGGEDYAISKYCVNKEKILYLNNGVDLDKYNNDLKSYDTSEINIYINPDDFNVIYTGAIGAYNGSHIIIDIAENLRNLFTDIKFIIAGKGTESDIIESAAKEKGLDNVVFLGHIDKKYIPSLLSKGSINLLLGLDLELNKYGLSPNKLFDYLASGKPIISNRPIKKDFDILLMNKCGSTVKNNIDSLKNEIIKYYHMDINNYNLIAENAVLASEKFDYKLLSRELLLFIEKTKEEIK
jgi:glycosyltransferase involved in cell wall biosynthesis